MPDLDREIVEIIGIERDRCSRTYGLAPCLAVLGTTGVRKCFNTRPTCQDPDNFDRGTIEVLYGRNVSGLPKGRTIFPAVKEVSVREEEINLSGFDTDRGPLGQRARIRVQLEDFTDHDRFLDPYQAERVSGAAQADGIGYDPETRGTHFTKMRARNPYYEGRQLTRYIGTAGQDLSAMRKATYTITEWRGPDANGVVEIEAQDPLALIMDQRAEAPATSRGRLSEELAIGATTFTVLPAGIGEEYPAVGLVTIGSELLRYTRVGDVFSLTQRAAENTTEQSHSVGDLVQEALELSGAPGAIVDTLIRNYTNFPTTWLDPATWAALDLRWLAGFDLETIVPRPEPVGGLIAELCQLGLYFYSDKSAAKLRYGVNRPRDVDEVTPRLTDRGSIVRGTLTIEARPDERASRVIVFHGLKDPLGDTSDSSNYDRAYVAWYPDGESPERHGIPQIKKITTRWFGQAGDDVAAAGMAERLLSRFQEVPELIGAEIDIRELDNLEPGAAIELVTRLVVDELGDDAVYPVQLQLVAEADPGHRLRIKARSFTFIGRFGFLMAADAPDYDSATAEEIAEGCFLGDENVDFPDGTQPYQLF